VGDGCRVGVRVGRGVALAGLSLGWELFCEDIVVTPRVPLGSTVIGDAVQERCDSKVGTGTHAAAERLHTSTASSRPKLLLMILILILSLVNQ
jgi:hypothetical protein